MITQQTEPGGPNIGRWCCAVGLVLLSFVSAGAAEKTVVGWVETVRICQGTMDIKAKLDTGAKTTSLGAKHIEIFERNGEKWVRFEVTDDRNITKIFEKKQIRKSTIKTHSSEPVSRPTVRLGICLGSFYKEAEVNLVDRSPFNYSMLIGRRFLSGKFIVDPAVKFTASPGCRNQCSP